jgi:hypothetical protein
LFYCKNQPIVALAILLGEQMTESEQASSEFSEGIIKELASIWHLGKLEVRKHLAGKSGASVMLVEASGAFDGYAILKVTPSAFAQEFKQQAAAFEKAGPFGATHFSHIALEHYAENYAAALMTIAGDGLKYVGEFKDLSDVERMRALGPIIDGILQDWNNEASASEPVTAQWLLEDLLGQKLANPDRLSEVCISLTGMGDECAGFVYDGTELPNPIHACRDSKSELSHISLSPIVGKMHGDLHGGNVLVHAPGSHVDFYIIDFAYYRDNAALLYDIAYFELSILLALRGSMSLKRWQELVSVAAKLKPRREAIEMAQSTDDIGPLHLLGHIRDRVFNWQESRFQHRREDIERQYRIAQIAAGLNYAGKLQLNDSYSVSSKLKQFAYLYAAYQLRELYLFEKASLPKCDPIRQSPSIAIPEGNVWRQAWDAAEGFNRSRSAFILLASEELRTLDEAAKTALTRLPWSLVLDFDHAGAPQALLPFAKKATEGERGFHHLLLSQDDTEVDFTSATAWLSADGWTQIPNSQPKSMPEWRTTAPKRIRKLAAALRAQISPRPVTAVILGEGIDAVKLRATYLAIAEEIEDVRLLVLKNRVTDAADATLADDAPGAKIVDCTYHDFAFGVLEMLGDAEIATSIRVPARPEDNRPRFASIPPSEAALFAETFALVYDGLVNAPNRLPTSGPSFTEGAVVSWRDLDRNLDVPRDLTGQLRNFVEKLLGETRVVAVQLKHKPGAGATTVARRIAWDLRNTYPCVIIQSYRDFTSDCLERLYQISGLPLFIVAERANLTGPDRERLFDELRSRQMRFVFLDVIRATSLGVERGHFTLEDQMVEKEAARFLDVFRRWSPSDRHQYLSQLTHDESLRDFRSPFFYCLYAFDSDFQNVRDYIAAYVKELNDDQQAVITLLALIGAYSQHSLPIESLNLLAGRANSDAFHIDDLLGRGTRKFVLYDGTSVRVVHPRLAKEILRQHLKPMGSVNDADWNIRLPDLCVELIKKMALREHAHSASTESILIDLFVSRTERGAPDNREDFSALILDLPNDQSRDRVLRSLCENFSWNPTYWNHLGRLLNFRELAPFEETADCYKHAIAIEETNSTHHHGLGMVYRNEVSDRLHKCLTSNEMVAERLQTVLPIYRLAEAAFGRARALGPIDEYPRISHIQMITRAIEEILKRSQLKTYSDLLLRNDFVSEWCVEQVSTAEKLLEEIHQINAERDPSHYVIDAEGRIQELFYGNYDVLINGLSQLLDRQINGHSDIRRSIAYCYMRKAHGSLSDLSLSDARRIAELCQRNLTNDPRNGHDLRLWFQAYRLLPEFSLSEAIERFSAWARDADALDAWYYLYILHFLNAKRGVRTSAVETRKYIEKCRRSAPELVAKRSFEWLASDKLKRPCPLLHHSELGRWKVDDDLFAHRGRLHLQHGIITEIARSTSGKIDVDGVPAFFPPGRGGFHRISDLNTEVTFYLGFSYEGLRAWNVQPVTRVEAS